MAKSKLGMFVQSLDTFPVIEWCRIAQPRVLVSMDHNLGMWREIKRVSPNTFIVGRRNAGDEGQVFDEPAQNALDWFNANREWIDRMKPVYDAVMTYNEPAIWNDNDARRLASFTVAVGDLVHSIGVRVVAYSFSVGHPALELWEWLADGLRSSDYLGLHEYSAPYMQNMTPDLCLRYRLVRNRLPANAWRPVVIGECGIDGGVIGRAQEGWRKFTDEAGYLDSLKWYDAQLQADDYVLGAAIFQAGPWGIDGSFGAGNLISIRDYIAAGGSPVETDPNAGTQPGALPPPDLGRLQKIANAQYFARTVSAVGIAAMVLRAEFRDPVTAIAVCLAESGGNPQAINVNKDNSVDRGLWQMNSKWHPEVSDECAFNPMCSTLHAARLEKERNGFGAWSSYRAGTYTPHLDIARLALAALGK